MSDIFILHLSNDCEVFYTLSMKEVNAFLLALVGFIYTIFFTLASDVSFSDSEKWYFSNFSRA